MPITLYQREIDDDAKKKEGQIKIVREIGRGVKGRLRNKGERTHWGQYLEVKIGCIINTFQRWLFL